MLYRESLQHDDMQLHASILKFRAPLATCHNSQPVQQDNVSVRRESESGMLPTSHTSDCTKYEPISDQ